MCVRDDGYCVGSVELSELGNEVRKEILDYEVSWFVSSFKGVG